MNTLTTLLLLSVVGQLSGHEMQIEDYVRMLEQRLRAKRQVVPLDPFAQSVDVSGEHAFVAPGPGDQRGPCPGLNALANHNYLPHNGVATVPQFFQAVTSVYGMGADLAVILSILGALLDGDICCAWSIGGAPPNFTAATAGLSLLGESQGLSHSHNKYETDGSPTRGDFWITRNSDLVMDHWEAMADLPYYDLTTLTPFRAQRNKESRQTNPYFFLAPVSGVVVQPAAYAFIYRFMANHSAEYPEGLLELEVLKSFFGVSGERGNFSYKPGHEEIPANWYRRAVGDEYGQVFFLKDLLEAALQYPEFLSIGGNTGAVNTFTGVDLTDLTGGLLNIRTLFEGDNLPCFVLQFAELVAVSALQAVTRRVDDVLLKGVIGNATAGLVCPELSFFPRLFDQYPGWTELGPDGSYPDPISRIISIVWSGMLPKF
nr:PREDICTED: aromatic peroxygenase-like [Bemisia tabaci]